MKLAADWLNWPQTHALAAAFPPGALRFVGGAVRDTLLARDVQDIDAAAVLLPEETIQCLQAAHIKAVPTGIKHGTVTALIDGRHFEITTLRRDIACDGRHAQVAFTDDWREDALRRDFTMNALYLSPEGELFDYTGGADDARAGHVRFIGDPAMRIAEDYLRVLRFYRFHAWYGKDEADANGRAACRASAAHLRGLSGERVQAELYKLLRADAAAATIALMQEDGVLQSALGTDIASAQRLARLTSIEAIRGERFAPYIGLALLLVNDSDALHLRKRLALAKHDAEHLQQALQSAAHFPPDLPVAMQKRLLRKLGALGFTEAIAVAWASGSGPVTADHAYAAILRLPEEWPIPRFPVTGQDLLDAGFKSGRELGEKLRQMEEKWEKSDYRLSRAALLGEVRPE